MLIKNPKDTRSDRRYFDEKGKINQAANEGRLGRSWFRVDENGKSVLSPKKVIKRV